MRCRNVAEVTVNKEDHLHVQIVSFRHANNKNKQDETEQKKKEDFLSN